MVLVWFYFLEDKGLICFTVFATITANIEVLLFIDAFSMEQTLGNVLFGATFLVTDILSEFYGKDSSKKAIFAGFLTSITFIIISNSWLLYTPKYNDELFDSFHRIFSNTPRLMIAGLLVYLISQVFDVWIYHKWWEFSENLTGDKRKLLWLRNNGSTLISQLLNSFLFSFIAFYGIYDLKVIMNIFKSSYIIFIVTSILDTPAIYLARYIYDNKLKS